MFARNFYSVKDAARGGYIVLSGGAEFATAPDLREAAEICAADAIAAYPECHRDFIVELAVSRGADLASVVRTEAFLAAVAAVLEEDFKSGFERDDSNIPFSPIKGF